MTKKYIGKTSIIGFMTIGFMAMGLFMAGCGNSPQPIAGFEDCVAEVSDITVPQEVKIIGLGEATHGNVELQTIKQEMFRNLVEQDACRVFVLEGDFGGCLKVNEYIHGGDGTAKEAVAEIGFSLYRTEQMEDFVEWLRDYNETALPEEQVSFYGFDMQRYDNNKEILFSYLDSVGAEGREELEKTLAGLTDETAYSQAKNVNKKAAEDMAAFLEKMEHMSEDYIAKSDKKSYEIAYACGECIMQNATIQAGEVNYNQARDSYMAEKVKLIMELENGELIMIAGHNGHIQKVSSNTSYTCMGERLATEYGEAYYTIGTDFIDGEVNVIGGNGGQTTVEIYHENALKSQVANLDGNAFYIDIAQALQNEEVAEILQDELAMVSVGNEFSGWQKISTSFYTTKDVAVDNYDGLIIYKTVTPTERKDM